MYTAVIKGLSPLVFLALLMLPGVRCDPTGVQGGIRHAEFLSTLAAWRPRFRFSFVDREGKMINFKTSDLWSRIYTQLKKNSNPLLIILLYLTLYRM